MKVAIKLYAMLSEHLAPEARKTNRQNLEVPEGTTVMDMIERFSLPLQSCHLVLVDGVFIAPEQRKTRALREGEVLAIWPPVAGG